MERMSCAPSPVPAFQDWPSEGSIMRKLNTRFLFIASLAFMLPGHAMAQDDDPGEWDLITTTVVASNDNSVFGSALAAETLDGYRGGNDLAKSDMTLAGTTAHNSASYVVTGANTISSGSFANLNGVPMVIQNSGANVLIQNATIINLQMN
jgi:hypothetical protein